jgi:hypothetical protein
MAARSFLLVPVCALLVALPSATSAQQRSWPAAPSQSVHIESEAVVAALGAVSAALVTPMDARVRAWAVSDDHAHIPVLKQMDQIFRPMGEHAPLGLAGAAWLIGAFTGHDELADAGGITVESIAATMALKGAAQRLTGRRRPDVGAHDPGDWGFARGFGDRDQRSFPSGHASNAFAFAVAVGEELDHIDSPVGRYVTPGLLLAATITSLSRVLDDQHWLSDVIAGAALGVVTGEVVADLNHR